MELASKVLRDSNSKQMPNFRDKVNSHLPIVLQLLSTVSLIVIALSAICGSKSLKQLASSHQITGENQPYHNHMNKAK